MDWDKAKTELQKKLDPKHVKPAPQGKYGEYIEGYHAIVEANRIFGEEGWSYTLESLKLTNATENDGKHHVGYLAVVSVVVDGVTRQDVGHGQGHGKSLGDVHDSAVKEAVTDALKRALRTFGNPFGLALYDKTKANVGVEFDSEATRDKMKAALQKAENVQGIEYVWGHEGFKADFGKLHPAQQAEITKTYTDALAAKAQAA